MNSVCLLEGIKNAAQLVRFDSGAGVVHFHAPQPSEFSVRTMIFPSPGVNFTALLSRFQKIWRRRAGSASIRVFYAWI